MNENAKQPASLANAVGHVCIPEELKEEVFGVVERVGFFISMGKSGIQFLVEKNPQVYILWAAENTLHDLMSLTQVGDKVSFKSFAGRIESYQFKNITLTERLTKKCASPVH